METVLKIPMNIIATVFLLGVSLFASPVLAQWEFNSTNSSFGKSTYRLIGMNLVAEAGMLFRCKENGDALGIYILLDINLSTREQNNIILADPKLVIRVDDDQVIEFKSYPDFKQGLKFVIPEGEKLNELVRSISTAKQQVAVAVRIGNSVKYENSFTTVGIAEAIDEFSKHCVK